MLRKMLAAQQEKTLDKKRTILIMYCKVTNFRPVPIFVLFT